MVVWGISTNMISKNFCMTSKYDIKCVGLRGVVALFLLCIFCLVSHAKPSKMDSIAAKVNTIEQRISAQEQEITLLQKELGVCEKELSGVDEHVDRANEMIKQTDREIEYTKNYEAEMFK